MTDRKTEYIDARGVSLTNCNTRLLAQMIIISAENTAPHFLRALTTHSKLSPEQVLPAVKLELCALYLHLFDRDVSLTEGREARDVFVDSLLDCLAEKIRGKTGMEVVEFAEFCNERQIEYSQYKQLFCDDGSSPAGTLFWEFTKRMGLEYEGYNSISLHIFGIAVEKVYLGLLENVIKLIEAD